MYKDYSVKVGIASFLMILAIATLLVWKSSIFLRIAGYELVGEFQHINGLLERAEVRYRGYIVGKVDRIKPEPKHIKVVFRVYDHIKIPEGSSLRVIFDGLVGEKYLDIAPNPEAQAILPPGGILKGYATSGLADFVDVGTQNLQELKLILDSFREALASQEVAKAMKNTVLAMEAITDNVNKLVVELRTFTTAADVQRIIKNLDSISRRVENVMDDEFVKNSKEIFQNFNEFSEELKLLLKDRKLKTELIGTLSESRKMFKGTGNLLGTLADIDLDTDLEFTYYQEAEAYHYRANFDFWMGSNYLRFGIGDRLGVDKLMNIQQSIALFYGLRTRFGVFYTKPGIGFDYQLSKLLISTDFYDFDDVEADFMVRYALFEVMDLAGGINNIMHEDITEYLMGVSLHAVE